MAGGTAAKKIKDKKKIIYLIDPLNSQLIFNLIFFCRQRLRALVGVARLSRRRECLCLTPTNARG
ncbi:MAG: hypothetical protein MPJ79_03345 [Alphaproteobacteria bacterium]|nr:hypothetical protein [Alphaproteobacteria bacterium]MDA8009213.1 hypothetical protein [Alphaproteobacteria bacterium]